MSDEEKKPGGPNRWPKGVSGNPAGRTKGSRNKLGEEFLKALHEDFTENGAEAIRKVRANYPQVYIKTIAGILPKELMVHKDVSLAEMSDGELLDLIDALRAEASSLTGAIGAPGARGAAKSRQGQVRKVTH